MLTEFGKWSRKLRIDHNQFLAVMAGRLGVSASFLSAVENGKKHIPNSWETKLINAYSLSEEKQEELKDAIDRSKEQVEINLKNLNEKEKDVALLFARNIKNMDSETKKRMKKLIDEM